MDLNRSKLTSNYDRVMPRVFNNSEQTFENSNKVKRHVIASSHNKISKKTISDASVRSDIPIVLNDLGPDDSVDKVPRRSYIVKPRRTLKSLDPPDTIQAKKLFSQKPQTLNTTTRSAPVLSKIVGKQTDVVKRSIVSDTKLRELKDEIKSYADSAKLSHIRSKLFKSCGVLLDEYGRVSIDKGVQVVEERVVPPKSARLVPVTSNLSSGPHRAASGSVTPALWGVTLGIQTPGFHLNHKLELSPSILFRCIFHTGTAGYIRTLCASIS